MCLLRTLVLDSRVAFCTKRLEIESNAALASSLITGSFKPKICAKSDELQRKIMSAVALLSLVEIFDCHFFCDGSNRQVRMSSHFLQQQLVLKTMRLHVKIYPKINLRSPSTSGAPSSLLVFATYFRAPPPLLASGIHFWPPLHHWLPIHFQLHFSTLAPSIYGFSSALDFPAHAWL